MHHLRHPITTSLRFAGQILRYHTWPTLHKQTIAEHTFHMLRLYHQIFGAPTSHTTIYILYHDCGEIKTGDLPFGAKASPDFAFELKQMENTALEAMGIFMPDLPDAEKRRVKVCDLLEMYEFGMQEVTMGNTYCEPVVVDTMEALHALLSLMVEQDAAMVRAYIERSKEGVP